MLKTESQGLQKKNLIGLLIHTELHFQSRYSDKSVLIKYFLNLHAKTTEVRFLRT